MTTLETKQWYDRERLWCEAHYRDGKLQDAGEVAAWREWDSEGNLVYEARYRDGKRQDK